MPLTSFIADNNSVTDEDNPLIDRKYPQDTDAIGQKLPVIHSFFYDNVPDFSQITMGDHHKDINVANNAVINTPHSYAQIENNPTVEHLATRVEKSEINSQAFLQKINTKTLTKRQAIAQAKAQAKALQEQKEQDTAKLQAEEAARHAALIAQALTNPRLHEGLVHQRKSIIEAKTNNHIDSIFAELAKDLAIIHLPETGLTKQVQLIYEKAVTTLFNSQALSEIDIVTQQKAYIVIDKLAQNNIADAMLRKAYWLFEGNEQLNLAKNPEEALQLTKSAASKNDNRAEKLLSKLYYSGNITPQDSVQGRFWLEQAAAHGHTEAIRLTQGLQVVNLLQESRQDENLYLKRLGIGIITLLIFMIAILVFIKI